MLSACQRLRDYSTYFADCGWSLVHQNLVRSSSRKTESLSPVDSLSNIRRSLFNQWLECLPIARETLGSIQVELHLRLKKWYLLPPCLTLNIIGYGSNVRWCYPGNGVAPSLAIEKGAFGSPATTVANFTYLYMIKIQRYMHFNTLTD